MLLTLGVATRFEPARPITSQVAPPGWRPVARLGAARRLSKAEGAVRLTFAVEISNMAALEEGLWAVSDPDSSRYGEHWTIERIADVSQSRGCAPRVASWVRPLAADVAVTAGGDFVVASLSPSAVEELLQVRLQLHEHSGGAFRWALAQDDRPTVPQALAGCLALVIGLELPVIRSGRPSPRALTASRRATPAPPRLRPPSSGPPGEGDSLEVTVVESRDRAFVAHVRLHPSPGAGPIARFEAAPG